MQNYKNLSTAYLKAGRVRSVVTIIGVALTVMVLYGGLNFGWSYLLYAREQARAANDYEFILLTDNGEDAQRIAADERIEKAYVGAYEYTEWVSLEEYRDEYDEDYEITTETYYDQYGNEAGTGYGSDDYVEVNHVAEHALYATGKNPYRMEKTMNELADDYGVEAVLNDDLASYYMQGEDTFVLIVVIVVLLVAYIFAIYAVGIIRNTVQMFMLEQVKDYGILRCVGATKKQLGSIIYCMGLCLELAGIAAGVVLGGAVSALVGLMLSARLQTDISAGYHLLPVIPVLVAYLGDLYFVMRECSKLVTHLTPMEAVRGEFRIRKEKIKIRGRGILGRLFGVEGEYARKNVMRNRGRLAKTVFGISVSIAAIVLVLSTVNTTNVVIKTRDAQCGKYQYRNAILPSAYDSIDYVESLLPSAADMESATENDCVLQAKKIYAAYVMAADIESLYDKYTDEYLNNTDKGQIATGYMDMLRDYAGSVGEEYTEEQEKKAKGNAKWVLSSLVFEGLDEADLEYLSEYLTDGTTDVSENGIVVVNAQSVDDSDDGMVYENTIHMNCMDYKVGDTIDIVDTELLYSRCYEALTEAGGQEGVNARLIIADVYDELIEEGRVNTYTVEGIVDLGDVVEPYYSYNVIYTSTSNYLAETGYTENQISGMKYQFDTKKLTSPDVYFSDENITDSASVVGDYTDSYISVQYIYELRIIATVRNAARYAVAVVVFIFSLSAVNIINTTAGSLHMRRREFAQLRVIGMSRDRLIKTVMLEGLMTFALSNVIGAIIGTAAYAGECFYLNMLMNVRFSPSVTAIFAGLLVSGALIFGSIYFPLRRLPQSMAVDLMAE